jgi:predicted Zn finger-like uncharacterized protein
VSRMFTSCPACRSNLAVSVADLRVGQGYVRCGRCDKVFNSLLTLAEEMDEEEQSGLAATGTASMPELEDPGERTPEEITLEPELELELETETETETPPDPGPQSPSYLVDEGEQATGTFETIVLEGDGYLQTEEHVDETEIDAHLQAIGRQMREGAAATATAEAASAAAQIDADALVGNRQRRQWPWWLAASVLAVALAVMLLHHNRQALVTHPRLEQAVKTVYGWFGKRVEPDWDVRAFDLRQLSGDVIISASDSFTVHASIHNGAAFAQPLPLIRVVLRDRFGNAVSTVDIKPGEYLLAAAPERMAPDQRLDATLRLADPTGQTGGFDLDACLADADGRIHCSNDP